LIKLIEVITKRKKTGKQSFTEIKELENGREIMRVRNEQLSLDVDTKVGISRFCNESEQQMNCWLLSRMT
jgi:hypothetical protein